MFNKIKLMSICFLTAMSPLIVQANNIQSFVASGPELQKIQITNMLANSDLTPPGMTETPVMVSFFNGGKQHCWQQRIDYQNDATIRVATGLGCATKITQITIAPLARSVGTNPVYSPNTVNLDTSKFATQILIVQDQAPVFDTQSGLVKTPGTLKVKAQMQLQ